MLTYTGLRKAPAWGAAGTAALCVGLILLTPATAQSVVQQLVALTCHDPKACVSITNTSPKGGALVGLAQNASAIMGQTTINENTNPNMQAPLDTNGGVTGVDTSTNLLDTNAGVYGTSKNGTGVIGITTFDSSVNGYGQIGVLGMDNSTTGGNNQNSGVAGSSNHNFGVTGNSFDPRGIGVFGFVDGGIGVEGDAGSRTISPGMRLGVVGVAALGSGGFFASSDPTLAAIDMINDSGGAIIDAFGRDGGLTKVMSLDNAGNMVLAGNIQTGGTPMTVNATSTARKVLTYAPQQSVRTVEDVGEARLVGGQAIVRLESTFASAIDTRSPYLVFITPQGKTSGLYVTQKTQSGFEVREYNGASNVAFDYRIVAQPYGSVAPRMPQYIEPRNSAVQTAEIRRMTQIISRKRPHIR